MVLIPRDIQSRKRVLLHPPSPHNTLNLPPTSFWRQKARRCHSSLDPTGSNGNHACCSIPPRITSFTYLPHNKLSDREGKPMGIFTGSHGISREFPRDPTGTTCGIASPPAPRPKPLTLKLSEREGEPTGLPTGSHGTSDGTTTRCCISFLAQHPP